MFSLHYKQISISWSLIFIILILQHRSTAISFVIPISIMGNVVWKHNSSRDKFHCLKFSQIFLLQNVHGPDKMEKIKKIRNTFYGYFNKLSSNLGYNSKAPSHDSGKNRSETKKIPFPTSNSHLVFTGQTPAVRRHPSVLLLHVGLDLPVLSSLLLLTRWWTALVLSIRGVKMQRCDQLTDIS